MRSGLYEGTVRHRRWSPRRHDFTYPLAMPLLDLAELDEMFALHPLWSIERANAVSFRRADFLGDPTLPLDVAVRDLVEDRLGRRPNGPIRLLAQLRTWGWLFNPLALYLCMDPSGETVEAIVVEVTNTPWHERHAYVLNGEHREHLFDKAMHVSPFFSVAQQYRLLLRYGGPVLVVHLTNLEDGKAVFDATLSLRRREVSRAALGRLLWRLPLLTVRVSAGIYWQALRLWLKGIPVHRHPGRTPTTRRRPGAHPSDTRDTEDCRRSCGSPAIPGSASTAAGR